ILRKARSAKGEAWRQICWRNVEPGIRLEDICDGFGIDSDGIANGTDLICKCDFQSMERIARVLDHFRSRNRDFKNARRQEAVQVSHRRGQGGVVCADNGERRIEEIRNGSSFTKELGIETHLEVASGRSEEHTSELQSRGH